MLGNMYGGGMYGPGAGGGQEMMIMMCCCICCVCVLSLFAGYWFNLFCSVSPSLGRGCKELEEEKERKKREQEAADAANRTEAPTTTTTTTLASCSKLNAKARGSRDPRPPIDPNACRDQERTEGRDCYYWKVDSDAVTGQARWVRVNDGTADARSGSASCKPVVSCADKIDFASTEFTDYTERNANALFAKCSPITQGANTKSTTIDAITRAARSVPVKNAVTKGDWTKDNSTAVYNLLTRYIGQNDLSVRVSNAANAAKKLIASNAFNRKHLDSVTFAYVLEAAIRKSEEPDWIISQTNLFLSKRGWWVGVRSREAAYQNYLASQIRGMVKWNNVLDNPRYVGIK